jgi:hypothetical protein
MDRHNSVIKPVDPLVQVLEALSIEDLALLMLALERKRKEEEYHGKNKVGDGGGGYPSGVIGRDINFTS